MGVEIGIVFALAALVSWGFGDFLIQKTTRKIGDWETLFIVTLFGSLLLFPLVYNEVSALVFSGNSSLIILFVMSSFLLVAAIIDFEALRKGKLAIVEPILALEIPITATLAFALAKEAVNFAQIILISSLVLGIVMVSLRSKHFSKKVWLERGSILAFAAAIFMGASNFLVGVSSRATSPLLANWFLNVFIGAVSLSYLASNKKVHRIAKDFNKNRKLVLTMCIFDNFAWISIAIAASIIPIAIAFALSESYIALAALLGLVVNREVMLRHQKLGLALTLVSAAVLCFVIQILRN